MEGTQIQNDKSKKITENQKIFPKGNPFIEENEYFEKDESEIFNIQEKEINYLKNLIENKPEEILEKTSFQDISMEN